MRVKTKIAMALSAAVAAGGLLAAATSANAIIVCNQYNECWHTRDRMSYPPDLGVTFHSDGWTFPDTGYHWMKDRDDRGYWQHGQWVPF